MKMRVRPFEHDGLPMKNYNFKANICARHVRIDVKNEKKNNEKKKKAHTTNEHKNANSSTTQTFRTKALKRVKNVVNKNFLFHFISLFEIKETEKDARTNEKKLQEQKQKQKKKWATARVPEMQPQQHQLQQQQHQ